MHPLLMDLDDAAALMGEHRTTTAGRARRGEIPGVKVGNQWRFWRPTLVRAVVGDVAARHVPIPAAPEPEPQVVSPVQLSELLGISLSTIMALLRAGQIPAGRTGPKWHVYWPVLRDAFAAGLPLPREDGDTSDPG